MTYFGFLVRFLVLPILVLALLALWDRRRGKVLPEALRGCSPAAALATLILIALVYTTPWDNYLVATRVWWYDPEKVVGITFGWVPLEEYTFFVLQPILVGLWLLLLARRLPLASETSNAAPRALLPVTTFIWLMSVVVLLAGWRPGVYLGLELAWALPPILLQLWFGADILWRHRRLVLLTLVPATLYLSLADTLAIALKVWTIDPEQSLGILLWGQLPIEEFVFFFLTTTLITFGVTLALATESWERLRSRTVLRA